MIGQTLSHYIFEQRGMRVGVTYRAGDGGRVLREAEDIEWNCEVAQPALAE